MSQNIATIGAGAIIPAAPVYPPPPGSFKTPLAHCNVRQVRSILRGVDLTPLLYEDETLEDLWNEVEQIYIPEATKRAVGIMRTNYDYSKEIWYFTGTGTQKLTLPRREIRYVNAVFLRILPSLLWYRFVRIRNADGSEFPRIGGMEPPPAKPETLPPDLTGQTDLAAYNATVKEAQYTGLEDADLIVDTRARTLVIPPRVLYATLNTPMYNWSFFPGDLNVEVHFAYGYLPTAYTDGQALQFDQVTGQMSPTSPQTGEKPGGAPVDWSSGMPAALSMAVARIAAADLLRRAWRANSQGMSSISIDGGSESYGNAAFGGDADREEARGIAALTPFAIMGL